MYELAVRVVTGVKMRTVTIRLISILRSDSSKMLLTARSMPFSFLTTLSCAMITVFNVFPLLKLFQFDLFLIGAKVFKLHTIKHTC